jgi:pimeloyl-ACP methyl ester carboxylesterase
LVPETGLRYTLAEWLPVTGDSPAIMTLTNPYAAFPSVHTGWALLVAYFAVRLTSSPWRHLWWAYPGAIVLSILATGNHFVLDPVASVPFIMVAFGVDRLLRGTTTDASPSPPPVVHTAGHAGLARRARRLADLGARPRSLQHPRNWVAGARLFIDYALTVPPRVNRVASKIRHYPEPFAKHTVTMPDGARVRLWLGAHHGRRPALVIVPGLFTSKDNGVVKRRALRIFHEWGFHVMTVDLRGNGESDRVPSTAGWKEADDLVHLVSWLRRQADVNGVGVYAESLAATAAVLAAARAGETGRPFAERGVLAISGYADVEATLSLYSEPPHDAPKALLDVVRFFALLLRASGQKAKDFRAYHEQASRYYGRDPAEAAADSTLWRRVKTLRDPVLVLHSQDDTLVPVEQAQRLERVVL